MRLVSGCMSVEVSWPVFIRMLQFEGSLRMVAVSLVLLVHFVNIDLDIGVISLAKLVKKVKIRNWGDKCVFLSLSYFETT